MLAAVTTQWSHIELKQLPDPQPGPGQCLVRPKLTGICGSDVHVYLGHHPTAKAPVVQGHEFVGVVEAIGPGPEPGFAVGDRVVVEPLISCGQCEACRTGQWHVCRKLNLLGIHTNGAFAERVLVDCRKVIKVPGALSDRVAALAEPFAVGVHVCRRAGLRVGESVLIIGAGPIGLILGMVAKTGGASVTFCEVQPERIEQARALGFPVIDGRNEPAAAVAQASGGEGFEVVLEASGSAPGVLLATDACRIRGRIVQVGFFGKRPEAELMKLIFKELTWIGSRVYSLEDFRATVPLLAQIAQQGAFDLDRLICRTCGLDELEASLGSMIRGEARGKILVQLP